MTLIETLVALAILGVAGVAMLTLARDTSRALVRALADDAEVRRASALLDAVTLWSREDLDRHLGTRQQGPWRMHVNRDESSLYYIALRDSIDRHELLHTTLYRPEHSGSVLPSSPRN